MAKKVHNLAVLEKRQNQEHIALYEAIAACQAELNIWHKKEPQFFWPGVCPYPICWFGNLNADKPIILIMGINPAYEEFTEVHVAYNPQTLVYAFNSYFNNPPYRFFKTHQTRLQNHGLDASYEEDINRKYQLIQVDMFPYATYPKWGNLKTNFNPLQSKGIDLLKAIIEYARPNLILSFGARSKKKSLLGSLYQQYNTNPNPDSAGGKSFEIGIINISPKSPKSQGIKVPIILSDGVMAFGMTNVHLDAIINKATKLGFI